MEWQRKFKELAKSIKANCRSSVKKIKVKIVRKNYLYKQPRGILCQSSTPMLNITASS